MLILDTNHVDALKYRSARGDRLRERLETANEDVSTTIITVQENIEGWLSKINDRRTSPLDAVRYYASLEELVRFYQRWTILPFDEEAARRFVEIRERRLRRVNDLEIAAIALCHNAVVLTQNQQDFEKIPNLRTDDWLLDPPLEEAPAP